MSLLNKIAALVGLIAGGTATWALLRYYPGPTPERVDEDVYTPTEGRLAFVTWDEVGEVPLVEWRRRLSERPGVSADWYRRRHHCSNTWIGQPPEVGE